MGVNMEASIELHCQRFVDAWKRFEKRLPSQAVETESTDAKKLKQFWKAAQSFLKQLSSHGREGELLVLMQDASEDIKHRLPPSDSKAFQVPRVHDIVQMRRQAMEEHAKTIKVLPDHTELELSDEDMQKAIEPKQSKLTTTDIRRRLGLLEQAKANADPMDVSEEAARAEQESLEADMMGLARQLKEQTQSFNSWLAEDNQMLDAVGQSAESTAALLEREHELLEQQLASSIGFWTSLYLVSVALIMFLATYFYIHIFSRRW